MVQATINANINSLIEILSMYLYADPLACIRELVSNAIDACLERRCDAPISVILVEETSLEVVDTGVGITCDQVVRALGTIGESTKRGGGPLDIAQTGMFGVGLLSAFAVASSITIDSRHPSGGISWQWCGGDRYEWEGLPAGDGGTRVKVLLRRENAVASLQGTRLRGYLAREFALTPVGIEVRVNGGTLQPIEAPPRPWQGEIDVLRWACKLDPTLEGSIAAVALEHPFRPSGGVVGIAPGDQERISPPPRIYRSGVRLARGEHVVPEEYRWLALIFDLPGISTDLAKQGFPGRDIQVVEGEVVALLDALARKLIDELCAVTVTPRWWSMWRGQFVRMVAKVLERGGLGETERELLREFLPFNTDNGPKTVGAIARELLNLQVNFDSGRSDQALFEWLRQGLRMQVREGQGASALRPTGGILQTFRGDLQKALEPLGILVHLSAVLGIPETLAAWQTPPPWVYPEPMAAGARRDLQQPVLLINANSPLVEQIARSIETTQIRSAAFLLMEWASADTSAVGDDRERIGAALFRLIGEMSPPRSHGHGRVFVAYDWTDAAWAFEAVRRALVPLQYDVLAACTENRGDYVLQNVRNMMLSCHVVVSIFTLRAGCHVTPSVLMEAGMASALPSRPHFLCVHRDVEIPANYAGVIHVPFTSPEELEHLLRAEVVNRRLSWPAF